MKKGEIYEGVIEKVDFVMQDIKTIDPEEHKKYTRVDNSVILDNTKYLISSKKEFVFRVPLIPEITDTEENHKQISDFVGHHRVELLSYNSFAGGKV